MARCLLGVLFVTAGLVALASATRGNLTLNQEPAPTTGGVRLRETEAVTRSGTSRTLFRPLPTMNISFSLN
jgi:hypothetical protein